MEISFYHETFLVSLKSDHRINMVRVAWNRKKSTD